jgi:hypothetical protein
VTQGRSGPCLRRVLGISSVEHSGYAVEVGNLKIFCENYKTIMNILSD